MEGGEGGEGGGEVGRRGEELERKVRRSSISYTVSVHTDIHMICNCMYCTCTCTVVTCYHSFFFEAKFEKKFFGT